MLNFNFGFFCVFWIWFFCCSGGWCFFGRVFVVVIRSCVIIVSIWFGFGNYFFVYVLKDL